MPLATTHPPRGRATARGPRAGAVCSRTFLKVRSTVAASEAVASTEAETQLAPTFTPVDRKKALLLQAFGWDSWAAKGKGQWYNHLRSTVGEIKAAGVTHIWLPPPSQSVSAQGYLPGQLYNLSSAYGSKEDLLALNAELKEAGVAPMADIVINHRCADEQDENGQWTKYRDDVDHEGHNIDWGRWAITGDDPVFGGTGNRDTGADFHGAPDLDHANPELREALSHWLQWLQTDIGFVGWRFDFVKGFAAEFIAQYVDASVGADAFNVGELWVDMHWTDQGLDANQTAARQALINWIDKTQRRSCIFDFVTKGILQEAVKNTELWRLKDGEGKAPGALGYWPGRAVTFVDNHDTGSSQQHWPFPSNRLGAGYAYILTHPGIPCLFWEHYFDNSALRKEIDALIAVRAAAGIDAESKLEILCAEADMYVARVGGRVTLKMGPRYDMGGLLPAEAAGWRFALSGKDYAVWVKEDGA